MMATYKVNLPDAWDLDRRIWAADQLRELSEQAGYGWLIHLAVALNEVTPLSCDHRYGFDSGTDSYRCTKCHALAPNEPGYSPATLAPVAGYGPLVTRPDLVDALKRARTKVNQEWTRAHDQSRVALSGAAYALDYLARELTPERDGAGALPVQPPEPVAATQPPAPSRIPCTCGRVYVGTPMDPDATIPGLKDDLCDWHGYRDREAAEGGLCGWRHPCYPDITCTVRADQWHSTHETHDVRGDISWDSPTAAQAPTAARVAKDWPEWKGLP